MLELAEVFALNACTHVVLHVDTAQAAGWELGEVVERWHQLCQGSLLSQRFVRGELLDGITGPATEVAEVWRV